MDFLNESLISGKSFISTDLLEETNTFKTSRSVAFTRLGQLRAVVPPFRECSFLKGRFCCMLICDKEGEHFDERGF